MNSYTNRVPIDMERVRVVVRHIFPSMDVDIERVAEGVSTYVYRITARHETWYLRILPEEGASFGPEAVVHGCLRQVGVRVPEVVYVEPYNELVERSVMVMTHHI